MNERPTVLIPLNRGHFIRLILYSGVIDHLAKLGCRVVILTPPGSKESLKKVALQPNIVFDHLPLPGKRFAFWWDKIYRYFFHTVLATSSSNARLEWIKKADPLRYLLITRLGRRELTLFRRFWLWARRLVIPGRVYESIFDKYAPDLVVVGTAGLNLEEYYLLYHANRRNIRTLCTLQSWDLLTTKGDVLERPQKWLVWNEENIREVVELFGYAREDVLALGVPHFDVYFRPNGFQSREEWLAQYGFDPTRKVLLVTPGAMHIHQNLPEVIQTLVEGINRNCFAQPVQVLIRPHPSVYLEQTPGHGKEEDLVYYESLHPLVKANRPIRALDSLYDNSSINELKVLANNLFHADVLIDFYGTVSIEAAMVDTPVVYADVRASFNTESAYSEATSNGIDYRQYTHLKNVFGMRGARTAFDRQDLYDLINQYLENPTLDRSGRQNVAKAFCSKLDDSASQRMASTIYEYAQGHWPPLEEFDEHIST